MTVETNLRGTSKTEQRLLQTTIFILLAITIPSPGAMLTALCSALHGITDRETKDCPLPNQTTF